MEAFVLMVVVRIFDFCILKGETSVLENNAVFHAYKG